VPVCCGPSMAAGCSSFVATGLSFRQQPLQSRAEDARDRSARRQPYRTSDDRLHQGIESPIVIRRSRHRWKRVKAALATARRAPAPCRPPSTVRTTSHQRRGRDISFSSCSSYRRMPCARSTLSPTHLTTSARPTNPQIRIMIVIHSVIYLPPGDQSQKSSRFVAASLLSAATNQK